MSDEENIFLFYPNLIGYARVILALISFYYMPSNHVLSSVCYVSSALLDAVDGHAARHFNQNTKFGAILDQLTDRCGTMVLCAVLAHFYPDYAFLFYISMSIDVAGHWIYLHTSLLQGKTSHKFVDLSANPIMRMYYTDRILLFFMCFGNETFFAALYLLNFTTGPLIAGISLFKIFVYLSTPIMLAKTLVSCLHFVVAAKNLSIIDVNERKALRDKTD